MGFTVKLLHPNASGWTQVKVGELYRADSVRMPVISRDLLSVLRLDSVAVVESCYPEGLVLWISDDLILLGERKVKVGPAVERYWIWQSKDADYLQRVVVVYTKDSLADNRYIFLELLEIRLNGFAGSSTGQSTTAIIGRH
jgi:hypothetical protein